jgi:hypothetical protein
MGLESERLSVEHSFLVIRDFSMIASIVIISPMFSHRAAPLSALPVYMM